MKKLLLCFVFLLPFTLLANNTRANSSISIYNDMDAGLFGRSAHRSIRSTVNEDQFARASTFYVNRDSGFYLTAVTLNKATADRLVALTANNLPLMLGEFEISSDRALATTFSNKTIYRFKSRRTGLDLSFSIEQAPPEMLKMVEAVYQDQPFFRQLVGDYYRNNYVIAIYAANNVFEPWHNDVTLADAMLAATAIGDTKQQLWGIHNGNNMLGRALALSKR